MSSYDNFGTKMRAIRQQRGYTLLEVAEKVGSNKQTLDMYENNQRIPKIDMAVRIAKALGISLADLVSYTEKIVVLTAQERDLLETFRELSTVGRNTALMTLKGLAGNPALRKNEEGVEKIV